MELELIQIDVLEYQEARKLQQDLIVQRPSRATLICCQHPPTITLTKRSALSAEDFADEFWTSIGITIEHVDRGGLATYHGPGQLMIYPVVNLRSVGLGVRSFVRCGLEALTAVARDFGVVARMSETPAGVWAVTDASSGQLGSKLGFAGLRIQSGFTDHGFALNVRNDLTPYSKFSSCGLSTEVTSLAEQLGTRAEQLPAMTVIADVVHQAFSARLGV